jgi:hypothetical protein
VNYRFAQPDNAMPVVVTQSYTGNSRIRIPMELRTIGDHIRRGWRYSGQRLRMGE